MQIKTRSVSVELDSNEKKREFWINPVVHGYGSGIRFIKGDWTILKCTKDDNTVVEYIIVLPNDSWITDLEAEGYTVVEKLCSAES